MGDNSYSQFIAIPWLREFIERMDPSYEHYQT